MAFDLKFYIYQVNQWKINTTYILNENNDVALEKTSIYEESLECEVDCYSYKEYRYEYIYDSKK